MLYSATQTTPAFKCRKNKTISLYKANCAMVNIWIVEKIYYKILIQRTFKTLKSYPQEDNKQNKGLIIENTVL